MAEPSDRRSLAPTTTSQEDLITKGQREINKIWELTQAFIASIVVVANMAVAVYQGFEGAPGQSFPPVLSSALFLIVGFYFSRTNHAAIGGIGRKPPPAIYEGR